jgi:predicted DNA-binding transcriptional regulator AlpA
MAPNNPRRYLSVPEVAKRNGVSEWTIYDQARLCRLPHRKHAGGRRLLFLASELDRHDDGASLEVTKLAGGGRVVRPVG